MLTAEQSVLAAMALFYALYLCWGTILTCAKLKTVKYLLILPVIFMTLHISWGLGFWVGTAKTYK